MENQRLFLIIAIVVVGLLLYTNFEKEKLERKRLITKGKSKPEFNIPGSDKPGTAIPGKKPTGKTAVKTGKSDVVTATGSEEVVVGKGGKTRTSAIAASANLVNVKTDVFDVNIDTKGGDIVQVDLLKYSVSVKDKTPLRLFKKTGADDYYAQTGFANVNGFVGASPNHRTIYKVSQKAYKMADGQDKLEILLTWENKAGVRFTKSYVFYRGSYKIDVAYKVVNSSGKDWVGKVYWELKRAKPNIQSSVFLPTFTGAAIHTLTEGYEKFSFDEIAENSKQPAGSKLENTRAEFKAQKGAWIAMLQHYFVSAWVPDPKQTFNLYTLHDDDNTPFYRMGFYSTKNIRLTNGAKFDFKSTLYIGPKIEKTLEPIAKGLELTIDFGWLTILSKPLFWLLDFFHSILGNWGWAIIFLTLTIKLAFYKLSETSYRSMARMRKIHPRLAALKERFGGDRQKLHEAMMKLYKEEKINPFGGCLPILVQIPVFIALYYALLESVELRQAPFMLWIQDLSIADPFFVLPLLMGATMILQHKLNPAPLDPVQQKVMMALPIVFTVFFLFFPAGLVLYWFVNNLLSIAQQWFITKRITGHNPLEADSR